MNRRQLITVLCGVVLLTGLLGYEPMRHNSFVDYDDVDYITQNTQVLGGLTAEGFVWAFTETDRTANWHPLTWLSHMLDVQLFGANPLAHHSVNLLLHLANTLLLFWIFYRVTGAAWPSFFIAAVFALHPLHVESVAWASERKDVLSGLFWMLTILTYIFYAEKPGILRYLAVVLCFILGLMAKPMLVTLPFVLLLLDYWPLERFALKPPIQMRPLGRLLAEKIPLFVLSAASCVVTFMVQQHAGAMRRGENYSLLTRLSNAAAAYMGYIGKFFYPVKLAVLYPHPGNTLPLWQPLAAIATILVITVAVFILGIRKRYLLIGWLWYLGTLVPVIGLVQVGSQAMADRYTYLPIIGLCVMLAWGVRELVSKWKYGHVAVGVLISVTLAAMTLGTRHQAAFWKDTLSLYKHTLDVTENNFVIHGNYGDTLRERGDLGAAVDHLETALRIRPDYVGAMNNLGMALRSQGKIDEAFTQWRKAIQLAPFHPQINANMGVNLTIQGRYDEAIPYLKTILQTNPDFPNICFILGEAYARKGDSVSACGYYMAELKNKPDNLSALHGLALSYAQQGRIKEAVDQWNRVLLLDPASVDTRLNLAFAMIQTGQYPAAAEYFKAALQLEPTRPDIMSRLASSYAAMGNLALATSTAERALELAVEVGDMDMANQIQRQLDYYKSSKK